MKKRAQAAMEFIMSYGWVIIIVLIAISTILYFVKPHRMILGQNCILSPGLHCKSYKADTDGITLLIGNPTRKDIRVTAINFSNHLECTLTSQKLIRSGSSETLTVSCDPPLTTGTQFRDDIKIIYDETGGIQDVVNSGTVLLRVP